MRVKIIKATLPSFWYAGQIGNIFNVEEHIHDKYKLFKDDTLSGLISKSDCEILPEENPQPEPFDLDRALKGEKVIDNYGIPILELYHFKRLTDSYRVCAVHNGKEKSRVVWYNDFGESGGRPGLFMAPKEPVIVTRWVNIYKGDVYPFVAKAKLFMTQNEAYSARDKDSHFVCSSPVTLYLNKQP